MSISKATLVTLSLLTWLETSSGSKAADPREREYTSPDGRTRLSAIAEENEDGTVFDLRLSRDGGAPVTIDTFMRDIDVYWSPDSKYVAVTDWIGSNVADCYVVAVADPKSRFSVTAALPKLPEDEVRSHFYVSCRGWEKPGHVWVMASGHSDYPPYHDFRYEMVYDVRTHQMTKR